MNYQLTLRSYAASLTAGVSNLYHLVAERMPLSAASPTKPGTQVGLAMLAQLPPDVLRCQTIKPVNYKSINILL